MSPLSAHELQTFDAVLAKMRELRDSGKWWSLREALRDLGHTKGAFGHIQKKIYESVPERAAEFRTLISDTPRGRRREGAKLEAVMVLKKDSGITPEDINGEPGEIVMSDEETDEGVVLHNILQWLAPLDKEAIGRVLCSAAVMKQVPGGFFFLATQGKEVQKL